MNVHENTTHQHALNENNITKLFNVISTFFSNKDFERMQ